MADNELVKFIQLSHRAAAKKYLESFVDYVENLEEEVDRLRKITQNPEAEMARLREENTSLKHQLAIQNNYSFSVEQRAAAQKWAKKHCEECHDGVFWEPTLKLTGTPLDVIYEFECSCCGFSHII